jgi:predicted MFS family arabinose efflux permease
MQQQKPLEGAQLVIMTIALSLATFMQVLDSTIANVAIPTIAGNLGSSLSQGTWVITSFGVANAISIPITGWLAKRVGEVKLFLWSTVAFAIASWACGMSNSLTMLIFFRVIQGIVAGPLIPLSQSLLLSNYPRQALYRPGAVVNDGDRRADLRPYPRRLYQRQLPLGLDLLYQRADWHRRGGHDATDPAQPRNPHRAAAD